MWTGYELEPMTKQEQFLWIVQTALLASTTTRLLRPENFEHLKALRPGVDPGAGTFMSYHVSRMRKAIYYGTRIPTKMSVASAAEDFLESFLDEYIDIRSFPDYEPPEWMDLPDRETEQRMWDHAMRSAKRALKEGEKEGTMWAEAEALADKRRRERASRGGVQTADPAARDRDRILRLASRPAGVQMHHLSAEFPHLSRDQIKRILQKLSSEGLVELHGRRRGATWRATRPGDPGRGPD